VHFEEVLCLRCRDTCGVAAASSRERPERLRVDSVAATDGHPADRRDGHDSVAAGVAVDLPLALGDAC
jgi:hypothetical protein